jgi:tetratricopeptide (TPR) repeat protein
MSPEQAEGDIEHLGPRSDVYSLGATLYYLLTGRPPREGDIGEVLLAALRGEFSPPRRHDAAIDRALEAVCLKAMAHRPSDRYGSPRALSEDIERWTADEPVAAWREPFGLRVRRWGRRNRALVTAAAVLLATGVAALGMGTVLVNRQRERAEANFRLARAAVDDMYTQVAEKWLAQEARMEPVQREFLIKALDFYERFASPAGSSAEARLEAGKAARRVGAIQYQLGDHAAADAAYRSSLDALRALAPGPAARVELLTSLNHYGWMLWSLGRPADDILREAQDLGESLTRDPAAPVNARVQLATTYLTLAIVHMACGRYADAEAAHGKAMPLREAVAREAPTVENREAAGRSHYHFARFLQRVGRFREADAEYGRAVAKAEAAAAGAPREPRPRVEPAYDLIEEASLRTLLGREKEAEAALRRALGLAEALQADFPSVGEYKEVQAVIRRDLAGLLNDRRQTGESRRVYQAAVADGEALVREFPDVLSYRWNLAVHQEGLMGLEWESGRFAEAEAAGRRALELAEGIAAAAPQRVDYRALVAERRFRLAGLLSDCKRKDEARPVYERALAEYEALVRDCPGVPDYRHSLAQLSTRVGDRRREAGDLAAAEAAYERTLTVSDSLARDFPEVPSYRVTPIAVRISLAKLAVQRRDPARARGLLQGSLRALEAEQKAQPDDRAVHSYRVTSLGYLARAEALEGDARAAGATARQIEGFARGPMEHFNAACYLSLLLRDVQDTPPGPDCDALTRTLADRAIAQLRKAREVGLRDLGPLLGDTDLDAIRTRDEFQAFVREAGAAGQPTKK